MNQEDSPDYERESALNDENSVKILENRYKLMYEQMFIRLYEHDKINIPKTELSAQLLGNLSKFFKPLISQIDPYKLGEKKRTLDIGAQYARRILTQFGSPINLDSARQMIDYLIHECPDHGYVIDKTIMELFVSNIHDSSKFGDEYKVVLGEISLFLMDNFPENTIVQFLETPVSKNVESEEQLAESAVVIDINASDGNATSSSNEDDDLANTGSGGIEL